MRITASGDENPPIGLGCMGLTDAYDMATPRDEATSIGVIRAALDLGMTLIDTADVYGPYTNEELIGRALAGGHRDRAVLATKVGLVEGAPGAGGTSPALGRDGSPEHIRTSIDASLRRLRTDHVDLYQLHRVDSRVPIEESWGAMADVVTAGKARFIGLSEVSPAEIARAHAVHPVATVQSELSLWTRDPLREVLPYCAGQGITLLAFAPLGRGFLTGRFVTADDLPADDFRRELPRFQKDTLRANAGIAQRLREVATGAGITPAQAALAWVIAQGDVIPIPGTKTPRYLAENARAAGVTLSVADRAVLDALPEPEGARY